MVRCINWDRYDAITRLRRFLAADCLTHYQVHRMNDRQVVRKAARELCRYARRTVIKPRIGWAVQVDPATRQPVPTIAVEPADDIDGMLAELKTHLDAIVAEAQKKKEQHQAALAGKNSAEVALYYSENTGDAVYQDQVVGTWDMLVSAVKKFPGFYKGFLKAHLKLFQFPGKMAQLTTQALYTGDMNPLKQEIDKIVDPVVHGYEQTMHYKSILTILLSDQQTYALLWDFAQRYYDASHPVELARLGATAAAEIVVTIVLALVSYGIGAAANIAAKSTRLVKVAKLLEKIALAIKRTKRSRALLENAEEAAAKTSKTAKQAKRAKKGMPDVDKPKAVENLDNKAKKGYDGNKKSDGPKTTTTEAGSVPNTNPGFPKPGRTQNCVNCSIATDHTFAGNPASALPSKRPQPLSVMEKHFGGKFKQIANRSAIEKKMANLGPGSRGIVAGLRSKGPGHVFNVVVDKKGVVKFFDGQTMKPASFEGFSEFRLLVTNQP
ncbi:MAG: toxin glutamine deamidase domain-containing protein [Desulfobacteraceae bacterium]